ncbi:MAG: type I restriction endonuclease subunit R [Kosmotoga sp.]|nr:MAG: type I restriction endonuclease subunit R [Kosmotoga sp.]
MSSLGGERGSVQYPLTKYATEIGWKYVNPEEALRLRGGKTGFLFKELFINQIQKLNSEFMNNILAEELVKKFGRVQPNITGNSEIWEYLKGIRAVNVPDEKRERNVTFFDTDNIDRNTFHVTDEFVFSNGTNTIRPDIVFLINGIPVLIIETKSASKFEGINEALAQIGRYHRQCPELLAILQLYSLNDLIRYYYSATWNTSGKLLMNWKDESSGNFEELVKSFLDRKRLIKVITDFILFTEEDDLLKKVVLRPHQMRAVDKVVERASNKEKRRGLIWHTQGSGKTYTMIVAAKKIMQNPKFENPTVIMLVDRNELETQLFGNIRSVGIEHVEVANSKRDLRKLLSEDRRGLIVSMIHKFEDIPPNINTRKNIFVLVDEAHRTTGGKLGNYLMGALPNATYLGFTGTPIDKTSYGKGTFLTFGKEDPPRGYLDKYSIAESIEDGATVPLHYTLAPNEIRVEKDVLQKEFLDVAANQGISDFEVLNKVLERTVTLRNMLKNEERIEKVAQYVANHFRNNIEPMGYKAFLVTVDREACALYKKALDKYLPPEYSKVVYSQYYNDPPEMTEYYLTKEEEKRTRKAFRNPNELPKILIVTSKLLTGFDAPILYCMYLDKPMRDHVLLQAIARVNRPYEDEEGRKKPSGFILDFVGIFDNLEKALAFDSKDIEGIVHDIQELKDGFEEKITIAREKYLSLIKGKSRDKAVEALLDHFRDEEERHKFYKFFKELSDIYDIISPDSFLRPYIDDMETLTRMYKILKEKYEKSDSPDRELTRKTAILVQKHTKSSKILSTTEIYEIDEYTLERLEKSKASDTEKVFNLLKSIEKIIEGKGKTSPYLISIAERAEEIAESYKKRQKTTQLTLEELKKLVEEINKTKKEQAEKGMDGDTYSIYYTLKNEGLKEPKKMTKEVKETIDTYPYWRKSNKQESKVRRELYKALYKAGMKDTKKAKEITEHTIKILKGRKDNDDS